MTFYKEFKRSFSDPNLYKMAERGETKPFTYLTNLSLALSFIATVALSAWLIPRLNIGVWEAASIVKNRYPSDLNLTINDGIASTDVERVFKMELTEEEQSLLSVADKNLFALENILVIDTSKSVNEDFAEIRQEPTLLFLAKDGVLIKERNHTSVRVESLKGVRDVLITHDLVIKMADDFVKVFKYVLPLLIVVLFAGLFIVSLIGGIITALLTALFVWLIKSAKHKDFAYKRALAISAYAATPAVVFNLVLLLVGGFTLSAPVAVLFALALWALNELRYENANRLVANP